MKGPRPTRLRRVIGFRKRFSARRSRGQMANEQEEMFDAAAPPDVMSLRAKSQRHGKSTADKWNQ